MSQQRPPALKTITNWTTIGPAHFIGVTVVALIVGILGAIIATLDVGPFQTLADVGGRHGSDQLAFFFPAAQRILDGQPFTIYAIRFGTYPNFNPPLGTMLIAPLLDIGQAILPGSATCVAANYASVACRPLLAFVAISFMPFVVLLGAAVTLALRAADPDMGRGQLLLAYALIVFSPLLWQDFTLWWHLEQPMMLFFFVAGITQLRQRPLLAGVLLGLALLTRTTAAVPLLALIAALATARAWPTLGRMLGAIAVVVIIGLAPFFLFDYRDTVYSLVTWRGGALIGNSIWSIFTISSKTDAIARHLDLPVAAALALAIGWWAVARGHIDPFGRHIWFILALAALTTPMLSKTIWPYYALEPWVLLVIWEFGTLRQMPAGIWRWPVLSVLFLGVATTLGQYAGLETGGGWLLRLLGVLQFGVMALFAGAFVLRRLSQSEQEDDFFQTGMPLANPTSSISRSESRH